MNTLTAMHRLRVWLRATGLALVAGALVACGGGGGGTTGAPACDTSTPVAAYTKFTPGESNAVKITVDRGPGCYSGYNVNRLFTSVTVCKAGDASQCQTIDHVLVDTGSTGLRLIHSALNPALLKSLDTVLTSLERPLLNCVQFADFSSAFGSMARADVTLGPLTAGNLPIQIVGDPAFKTFNAVCHSALAINTMQDMGANGILGVGLRKHDCGAHCASNTANNYYFTCTTSGTCTEVQGASADPQTQQLANPVALFSTHNNGVVIDLPGVPAPGAGSIAGRMLFGIDTHTNNLSAVTNKLQANSHGIIQTVLKTPSTLTLNGSFIDSGSNALFFGSAYFSVCTSATDFYCPGTRTTLSTTLAGANPETADISLDVDDAISLFTTRYNVLPSLAGPFDDNTFDLGLPFFYGRKVFFLLEDEVTPLGTGPLYAF